MQTILNLLCTWCIFTALILDIATASEEIEHKSILDKAQSYLHEYGVNCTDEDLMSLFSRCGMVAYNIKEKARKNLKYCKFDCKSMDQVIRCVATAVITDTCVTSVRDVSQRFGILLNQYLDLKDEKHKQKLKEFGREWKINTNCSMDWIHEIKSLNDLCPGHMEIKLVDPGMMPSREWAEWEDGRCSSTCGQGLLRSFRICEDPLNPGTPEDGCIGQRSKTEVCQMDECLPPMKDVILVVVGAVIGILLVVALILVIASTWQKHKAKHKGYTKLISHK